MMNLNLSMDDSSQKNHNHHFNPVKKSCESDYDTSINEKHDHLWVKIFGEKIMIKFIDYLYFLSSRLYISGRYLERTELVNFIQLMSSQLNLESK